MPTKSAPLSPTTVEIQPPSSDSSSSASSAGTLEVSDHEEVHEIVIQPPPPQYSMTTRGKSGIVKPNPKYALFTVKTNYTEPKNIKEALKDSGWTGACKLEIDNMKETHTWDLVPPAEDQNPALQENISLTRAVFLVSSS